jgi:DNA-binding response OmpR family regulator
MAKILVVDDDVSLLKILQTILEAEDHVVETAPSGQEGIALLRVNRYELVILDLHMPGMDGTEVCKEYRRRGGTAPVLFLTADRSEEQVAKNLDIGADDYLTKPFENSVLCARIRALLRRAGSGAHSSIITAGNLMLDMISKQLTKDGVAVRLLPKEYALLEFLMLHQNQVFTQDALLERVWRSDNLATSDTVRTHIKALRKKIDSSDDMSFITTIHRQGYRFDAKKSSVLVSD